MLIQFSVGNFRSFKDIATLSMLASTLSDEDFTFHASDKIKLLRSSVIYGANGSGKSNLLKAMSFMKNFVINSSKETQANEPINVDHFKLSSENENKPAYFEAVFMINKTRYRYGFEADNAKIHSEWLFSATKIAEKKLFTRNEGDFEVTDRFVEGKGIEDRTRANVLFLSVAAQWNGPIAQEILNWFARFSAIETVSPGIHPGTIEMLNTDSAFKKFLLNLLKIADLSIEDLRTETVLMEYKDLPPTVPEEFRRVAINAQRIQRIEILTKHKKFKNGKFDSYVELSMGANESGGTNKVFALAAPLYDTLQGGKVLVIDELDARFHPLITESLVKLFHSKETNRSNAQLIFCTHDVNLLNSKLFRRDQIWFTEKDRYEASKLFSLAEYRVRKDASFDKDYMQGKYGAIPHIGDLSEILKSDAQN